MNKKFNLAVFALAALLSGCDKESVQPSETMEGIEQSYQKIETAASQEEIDKLIEASRLRLNEYVNRYKGAKDVSGSGYDVGVVPSQNSCPLYSEMITFYVDNENDNPNTRYNGWIGAWEMDGEKNTTMRFCKVDGRVFNNMRGRFGVLKFGPNNPSGFRNIKSLGMDNQDSGTTRYINGTTGALAAPNLVDGDNLTLVFTEFDSEPLSDNPVPNPTPFPDLGFSYGVFGWTELAMQTGQYLTDDEDHNCDTMEWFWYDLAWRVPISYTIERNSKREATGTNFRMSKVK